jgi:hypothetical protein
MNKNRLWIMIALVAVLGGLTAWAYWPAKKGADEPEKVTDPWKPLDKAKATRLVISRAKIDDARPAIDIELEKKGDAWVMNKPAQGPADATAVNAALDQLAGVHATSVLSKSPESHATFEIEDTKAIKLQVFAGADVVFDVLVGKDMGADSAVRVPGGAPVMRADRALTAMFSRNANEWRDKSIAKVDRTKVKSIEWTSPTGSYKFDRAGESWTPVAGTNIERLDTAKLDALASALYALNADNFGDAGAQTGVTPNSPSVTIVTTDGATTVLRLGAEKDGLVYVQREASPVAYLVSLDKKKSIAPTLDDLQAPAPPPAVGDGGVGDASANSDAGTANPNAAEGGVAEAPSMPPPGGTMTLEQLPPQIRAQIEAAQRRAAAQGAGGAPAP